jgi:hypothetical protein
MSDHTAAVSAIHQFKPNGAIQRLVKRMFVVALGVAALATALAACGAGGAGSAASSSAKADAGRIVIQLFDAPGFIYPSVNGVPEWTLYGDNTLLFQDSSAPIGQTKLVSVQLTSAQAAHIIDVVVNQRHFFASAQPMYGRRIPDAGLTLLYVAANGQQKMVGVGASDSGPDAQTQNVFAIVQFLRGYLPASAQPYAPTGVGVLAIAQGQATAGETAWSAASVSLATVASHECSLLRATTCSAQASQSGVSVVHGAAGTDLLRQSGGRGNFAQGGVSYSVTVWPLTPDALHPQPGKSGAVRVAQASGAIVIWPLLG